MIKHFCDLCERDITEKPHSTQSLHITLGAEVDGVCTIRNYEICKNCAKALKVIELLEL
jgi:hypothetical protein